MATRMMASVEEVQERLLKAWPDADVGGVRMEGHRITGVVCWEGFRRMSLERRLAKLAQVVRDPLGAYGLNIGPLYPLAPGEKLDD